MKIIDSKQNKFFPDLKELLKYRDLFLTLSWRDFRVRYAQTSIGLLWAILQPVATLIILSLVFGKFIGIETHIPHILFTVSGLSIWTYFAYVITNAGSSIIFNQNMVKKIYFPRIILPLSKAVIGFIDFGISLFIMIILMIYFEITPSLNFYFAPLFILTGVIAALSFGIWVSALTVRYRDFQYVVPFIIQIGLYITPIAYPAELAVQKLPKWASTLYYLNPMAGVIQGFRWSIFGGDPPGNLIYVSLGMIIIIFISGIFYFQKVESEMADYV